jgi:hypothetical protein
MDGFVVCCKECGYFQLGYSGFALTLTAEDFEVLYHVVRVKCTERQDPLYDNVKCIFIPTPCKNIHLFLTPHETVQFFNMLEKADNEEKALSMMSLFKGEY